MNKFTTPHFLPPFFRLGLLIFAVGLFALPLTAAFAQIKTADQEQIKDTQKIFEALDKETQENILDETAQIQQQCAAKETYATYHDCQCIADKFFVQRVLSGPDKNAGVLLYKLDRDCINSKDIIAYNFGRCLKLLQFDQEQTGKTALCSCAAKDMAELYEKFPNPDYHHMRKLFSQSVIACRRAARDGLLDDNGEKIDPNRIRAVP